MLDRIWRPSTGATAGVPRNVLESAERLRRELHPERGPVDWRPVRERRRRAEARIRAVERYARARSCRRAGLIAYFGETLHRCAGCDRCSRRPSRAQVSADVAARVNRLRRALAGKTAWGGCPLEPDVLLRLAQVPPATAATLADVTGVGPAVAERLGGTILHALGTASDPEPEQVAISAPTAKWAALSAWRADVARRMGVPPYVLLPDEVLRAVAAARPRDRAALARVPGIGPRALAKFAADLVALSNDATAT